MVWSAVTMAFFGLLRSAEYTSPSRCRRSDTALTLSDVLVCRNKILINIRASKTDQFRQGTVIRLFRISTILCPVQAAEEYLRFRNTEPGPFFQFANGAYLTRHWLSEFLQRVFPTVNNINTHSFRIGGATAAASQRVSDSIIQTMGRWNSDCFQRYIRVSDVEIARSQRNMAMARQVDRIWDSEDLCSRDHTQHNLGR